MADPDPLIVERPSEAVRLLKLNRPERRNALNVPLRKRIAEEVTNAVADRNVRAIVLTGNEQAFAAGADIGEMADAGPIEIMIRNVQQYYRVVAECPKPVIVAIEGFALGGGLELALCADVIIAADGARLGRRRRVTCLALDELDELVPGEGGRVVDLPVATRGRRPRSGVPPARGRGATRLTAGLDGHGSARVYGCLGWTAATRTPGAGARCPRRGLVPGGHHPSELHWSPGWGRGYGEWSQCSH